MNQALGILELRGLNFGAGRQPLSDLQQLDRTALKRILHCIMADYHLVVDAPDFRAPRTGNLERDKVVQIAEEVMQALRQRGIQ
jgi:hypothetical protein